MADLKTPTKAEEKTGNWFYLCQGCHQPSLIFRGEKLPNFILPIDELDYQLAGTFRSRQPGIIICGWCKRPTDIDTEGRVNQKNVIQVDSWCKAKGRKISEFGVAGRPAQENDSPRQDGKPGFFDRDEHGEIVPSKSECRWVIRAIAPDRPKTFSTLEAP